jgi:hypothetical protein
MKRLGIEPPQWSVMHRNSIVVRARRARLHEYDETEAFEFIRDNVELFVDLKARIDALRKRRAAAIAIAAEVIPQVEIADAAGLTEGRIAQIVNKQRGGN